MERILLANCAHHRLCINPCTFGALPPHHLSALSASLVATHSTSRLHIAHHSYALPPRHPSTSASLTGAHSPSRLRLSLPSRLLPRSSFGSLFLASLEFLPFPLLPRCPKHSNVPIACISSSAFTSGGGGGGTGPGGGSGGGGGGYNGGDGFVAHGTGTQSFSTESDDMSIANSVEHYIFLDVGGMSCGGCASSVKKILESQPHVLHASVNLATETAVVKVSLDSELTPPKDKVDIGEALAKHLSGCGFKSSVREKPIGS